MTIIMEINKIKDVNNVYETINNTLNDIEKEIEPYEIILNSKDIAYEMESKVETEKKLKIVLIKIKKLNKNVKQFQKDVLADKEIENIFYPKTKVLIQKYSGILKRMLIINDKFGFLNKDSKTTPDLESNDITINIDSSEEKQLQKITQTANQNVKNTYNNTLQRNYEMNKLAADIRELYEMFQDFAILVDSQHEQIISIENHIEDAQVRVQKGNENLRKSIEYQKKTRKKYCCFILVIVIILVIILSVFGSMSFRL